MTIAFKFHKGHKLVGFSILIAILIAIVFQSCSFIAKLGHGANKPKIETHKSADKWLVHKGFTKGYRATVCPEEYYSFFQYLDKMFLFDSSGRFYAIGYHQAKKCIRDKDTKRQIANLRPAAPGEFLPDSFIIYQYYESGYNPNVKSMSKAEIRAFLQEYKKTVRPKVDTFFLDYSFITKGMRSSTGEKIDTLPATGADFTLILPYAKFNGNWVQVSRLRKFYEAAVSNRNARINIIFLNLDKQKWWGEKWNKEIHILN